MIQIELIRQEIERLEGIDYPCDTQEEATGFYNALDRINDFLDTLQEPEVEYIRKDALMEYFHSRVEELNSPLNGVFGSTEREHCNERISELLLLVDKLNEM